MLHSLGSLWILVHAFIAAPSVLGEPIATILGALRLGGRTGSVGMRQDRS
jgi:hypothetical protein